ncbi:DUF6114 domain-containing protein [Nocardiopsis sp. MG754419]|uniref:DUF6114 domain-containing protein n=1 Tax=Nocardiopsis sp. MG754419 TaxID=2259865 RepID=UPI001BADF347|nr:DUF6114 domain-containing protein [Nocardiopsis sp. MG754419]MBR8741171.1 hypothetical protein [Nocardiopsis sp. MG754419]
MAQAMTLLRAGWGRFRGWRRTRPFWGGVLLVAAGIELLVAPAAQSLILPIDLIIYAGVAGVSGTLIGVLLIVIGVLSWLQPAQHTFFGVVGLLLSLASFVTSNFGGFVIGMLLGIIGGALVFAWGPDARHGPRRRRRAAVRERAHAGDEGSGAAAVDDPQRPADADTENAAGPEATEATETDTPGTRRGRPDTVDDPRGGNRPSAALALPLVVAVTIAAAPAPTLGWPWDWFRPGDDERSEEGPEAEEPSEAPSEPPTGAPTEPPGETAPEDGSDEDGSDEDGDDADEDERQEEDEEEEAEDDADPAECELRRGDGAVVEDEEELLDAVMACRAARDQGAYPEVGVAQGDGCFRGSVRDSGLTADGLTMFGARYEGVVECPTVDGPRRYLRLTMDRTHLTGGELWFDDAGSRRSLGLPTMDLEGDVELHVTSMRLRLLGIPLTFTPDFPPPLLLPIMHVTDVDVGEPMASTDRMVIPDLDGRFAAGPD